MAYIIGTIREFETENFRVIVDAIEESCADLPWDEDVETRRGIESGRLILFCARARVLTHSGIELASDYLGNCVYDSLESFEDHRDCGRYNRELESKGEAGRCGSYFSDMIAIVCRDARREYARVSASFTTVKLRSVA